MKYLPAEVGKKAYQTCPFKQSHFYFIHFLDRRQYTHTHACLRGNKAQKHMGEKRETQVHIGRRKSH